MISGKQYSATHQISSKRSKDMIFQPAEPVDSFRRDPNLKASLFVEEVGAPTAFAIEDVSVDNVDGSMLLGKKLIRELYSRRG